MTHAVSPGSADLDCRPLILLCGSSFNNTAQSLCNTPLLADDFPHVIFCHTKSQYDLLIILRFVNDDSFRMIDQGFCDNLDYLFHAGRLSSSQYARRESSPSWWRPPRTHCICQSF